MSRRALLPAMGLLRIAAIGVALTSTTGCGCEGYGWGEKRSLELGVSVDLHAVAQLDDDVMPLSYTGLAVGADGTIVAWGFDFDVDVHGSEPFVEVSSFGTVDLRAISAELGSWWVVGDAGTAAVSGDHGQTWMGVDLSTTADLHAIARVGSEVVVAGDEIVLVQNTDGAWTRVAAPDGEWGQLRALYNSGDRLHAVGLGGVIWSTNDPRDEWVAETSGTHADLFALGELRRRSEADTVVAVGSGGTVLLLESNGWEQVRNRENTDLVDYDEGLALGANGELFDVDHRGKLSYVDTFSGARAIAEAGYFKHEVAAVGDDGAGFFKQYYICPGL
jgi:hypothetical protein